jgi:hypothetical protein
VRRRLIAAAAAGALSFLAGAPAAVASGAPDTVGADGAGRSDTGECPSTIMDRALTRTVHADRPASAGETLQLRVRAQVTSGESLVVATDDGRILGAVSPFGPVGPRSATTSRMSAPPGVETGPVTLRFWIVGPDGSCRAPAEASLREVALIPVSGSR